MSDTLRQWDANDRDEWAAEIGLDSTLPTDDDLDCIDTISGTRTWLDDLQSGRRLVAGGRLNWSA